MKELSRLAKNVNPSTTLAIDAMAKQMRALVERLLELARAENEQASRAFTPCDLSQITESSALLFEAALLSVI